MKSSKTNKRKVIKIKDVKITPLVKSLIGVIKLPKNYDYKKDYTEYLFKKYNSLK